MNAAKGIGSELVNVGDTKDPRADFVSDKIFKRQRRADVVVNIDQASGCRAVSVAGRYIVNAKAECPVPLGLGKSRNRETGRRRGECQNIPQILHHSKNTSGGPRVAATQEAKP